MRTQLRSLERPTEQNKEVARRWHEAWGTEAFAAAQEDCLDAEFRAQIAGRGWVDRSDYASCASEALGPLGGGRPTVEEAVAEGETVMVRLRWNPARSGGGVALTGLALDRFRGHRIVEQVLLVDRAASAIEAAGPRGARRGIDRLPLRSAGRVSFLRVSEIEWIDAAHNYVRIHTRDGRTHVAREAIGELEHRLSEDFMRVHRSTIINIDCLAELEISATGNHVAILTSGQRLSISRSFRDRLPALVGS